MIGSRLDLLRPFLDKYTRRFSVLDIGGGVEPDQNIGQQIAREYDAVVTVIEKDWSLAKFEQSPNTMVLHRWFSAEALERLSECEHFDVVLAFNVLHWFGQDAIHASEAVRRMGSFSFVQIPKLDDVTACGYDTLPPLHEYFSKSNWNWELLGETVQFDGHRPRPLWVFRHPSDRRLTKTWVGAHAGSAHIAITAQMDLLRCYMKRSGDAYVHRPWISGINLWNFCKLGGVWPDKDSVLRLLRDFHLPADPHGDIAAHNFIFDGEALHLIDGYEGWQFDDREGLTKAVIAVEEALT